MRGRLARCRPAGGARACGFAVGGVDHPCGLIGSWCAACAPSWPVLRSLVAVACSPGRCRRSAPPEAWRGGAVPSRWRCDGLRLRRWWRRSPLRADRLVVRGLRSLVAVACSPGGCRRSAPPEAWRGGARPSRWRCEGLRLRRWCRRSPRRADRLVAVACSPGRCRRSAPPGAWPVGAVPSRWRCDGLRLRRCGGVDHPGGLIGSWPWPAPRAGAVDLLRRMGGQLARCCPAGGARACGFAGVVESITPAG